MVGDAVEQGTGEALAGEDRCSFLEGQVGCDDCGRGPQAADSALALRGNRTVSRRRRIKGLRKDKGPAPQKLPRPNEPGWQCGRCPAGLKKRRSERLILAPWSRQARACGILVADPNMIPPDIRLWRPSGDIQLASVHPWFNGSLRCPRHSLDKVRLI